MSLFNFTTTKSTTPTAKTSGLFNFEAAKTIPTPAPAPVVKTPTIPTGYTTPVVSSAVDKVSTSLFSKLGSKLSSVVSKVSNFVAGAAEAPTYTNDSWSQTFRNLPNEVVRTILPNAAALNDNPDLAADVSNKDVVKEIPGLLFENFVAPLASFAQTFYGITNTGLSKIGVNTVGGTKDDPGNVSWSIPGLGKVTNMQARLADELAHNGAPDSKTGTAATVAKYTGAELLNGLFAASLISGVVNPRIKSIADISGEQSPSLSKNPGTLGTGETPTTPRSFDLYQKPTMVTPSYTKLSPSFMEKLTNAGIDMSKYDPANPTFFKFEMNPDGQITGKVLQVKPSYLDQFLNILKGDVTKVPPNEFEVLNSKSVHVDDLTKTPKEPTAPAVTDEMKTQITQTADEISNPTPPERMPGTAAIAADVASQFALKEPKIEGMNPDQKTKLSPEEVAPRAQSAADQYYKKYLEPSIKEGKATVIGADDFKDYFGKDYNDNNHPVYSRAAFLAYERALVENKGDKVIFTGGGPASGKTELMTKDILDKGFNGIIYDSNMANYAGVVKQIEMAKAAGKKVYVYGVLPDIDKARTFSIQRENKIGRGISDATFARGHAGFPNVVQKLLENGVLTPNAIKILDTRNTQSFEEALAKKQSRDYVKDPLAVLKELGYNEEAFKQIYAKEKYNVSTGERRNPISVGGKTSETSARDRSDQRNADRRTDENLLEESSAAERRGGRVDLPVVPTNLKRVEEYKKRLKISGADPVLVDTIITPKGGTAYGVSVGDTLIFERLVQQFTEDHEMFHQIFTNMDNMRLFKDFDKKALFNEARDTYGDLPVAQLEEEMAKDFQQYVNEREANRESSFFGKIKDFFSRLYASLKKLFKNQKDIEEFYRTAYEEEATENTVLEQDKRLQGFIDNAKTTGEADFRQEQYALGKFLDKTPLSEVFDDSGDLTLKTLTKLKGRATVSKQFIEDLTNSGDVKQVERDLIRSMLTDEPSQVNVPAFAEKVKAELLPLRAKSSDIYTPNNSTFNDPDAMNEEGDFSPKYENVALPEELRGDVADYKENIYESPIPTSAGDVHFQYTTKNYFGHTRIEDMQDLIETPQGRAEEQTTRRVIEVQSDLYQKGRLESEKFDKDIQLQEIKISNAKSDLRSAEKGVLAPESAPLMREYIEKETAKLEELKSKLPNREKELQKLAQYNDPTAHFRMVREEVRKAAQDGKTKLQFPTGETAMKIEGLGDSGEGWDHRGLILKTENLKNGIQIRRYGEDWIITDVLGDGKFKAVQKNIWEGNTDKKSSFFEGAKETFDISGKVDTNNPIYKFYEKDLGKYLKNNYGAKPVIDDKGVTWMEVPVDPTYADMPVPAFNEKPQDIDNLRKQLARDEQSLEVARSNPEMFAQAYGPDRARALVASIDSLKTRIARLKNPTFDTGDKLADLRMSLDHAEKRVNIAAKLSKEKMEKLTTPAKVQAERSIPESKIDLSPALSATQDKIAGMTEAINGMKDLIDTHPGKKLQQFMSRKEGIFEDFKNPDLADTESERKAIQERNAKVMKASLSALEGTPFSDEFDNPDTIREQIDAYRTLKDSIKDMEESRRDLKKEFYAARKEFFTTERDRYAVNGILEREYRLQALKEVEKILRKEGRDRKEKVDAIQEYFSLTDSEMKDIKGNKDFRLMSDKEFDDYLKGIEGKSYEMSNLREAKLQIENTIHEMELKKVDNLREALKLKKFDNMSIAELQEFDSLLQTFSKGDEFLGKRQIQTVRFTDMAGIKTKREALNFLARESGLPIESMNDIKIQWTDKFLYDTALARKNPLYKVMVDSVNLAEVEAGLRFHQIKTETEKLMRAARASRQRSLINKLIPTDQMIFDYFEGDEDTKKQIAVRMTPQEYKAALYIKDRYAEVRDYLAEQEIQNNFRENYITHTRRDFLEAWKDSARGSSLSKGFTQALTELFDAQKQQQAIFNILDQQTGDILPLEKFFKFSQQRSGNLVPSKNVSKAFLEYMQTFEKKRQLDSFIPKLDIFAHVLTPTKTTTRGLEMDTSIRRFVKQWINSKKGRVVDTFFANPGTPIDTFIRSAIALTRVLDLGLSLPVGLASNVGEQVFNVIQLGPKTYARGVARYTTPTGRKIADKYTSLIGDKFVDRLRDSSKSLGSKFGETLFGLFSAANRRSNAIHLLAEMTPEEYKAGEISTEKLAEIRQDMSKYHVVGGMESMAGKTSIGLMAKQYKTWALPMMHTTLHNLSTVSKMAKDGKFKEGVKSQEAAELLRASIIVSTILLVGYGTYQDLQKKKNKTFLENLAYKMMNDGLSAVGALDPSLYLSEPRVIKFVADVSSSLSAIVSSLVTNTRTDDGDVAGLKKLGSTFIPVAAKQIAATTGDSELSDLLSKQSKESKQLTVDAQTEWDKLKTLGATDQDAASAAFEQLVKDNPALAKKVSDIALSDKLGLTDTEKQIKSLGVENGERALYLYDQTLKLKTPEEKATYIGDLIKKKVVTKKVSEQIAEMVKEDKPVFQEDQPVSESGMISTVMTYAKAIGTDPVTAFNRIFTGQKIRRVENGAIIVERMSLEDSSKVKSDRGGNNPTMKLDHTIPLEIGGSNSESNLALIPTAQWEANTPVENYLGKALKAGTITKEEAQDLITKFKNGELKASDIIK